MRRLITVLVLTAALLVTARLMGAQPTGLSQLFGRRDAPNHVVCYSVSPASEHISCVYVPPDGTTVRFIPRDKTT